MKTANEIITESKEHSESVFIKNQRANKLRKNKDYSEALNIYRNIWNDNPDEWTAAGYMNCARNTGKSEEALIIGEQLINSFPDFKWGLSEYAMVLYSKYISGKGKLEENNFEDICLQIIDAVDNKYMQIRTILKIGNIFKTNKDWNNLIIWLGKINIDDIPENTKKNPKMKNMLSLKERWLLLKIKAVYNKNENNLDSVKEKMFEIIEYGKVNFPKNIHIFRWEGIVLKALNKKEEAIIVYEKILKNFRKEWYINAELASLYSQTGYESKAEKICYSVLSSNGQLKMKVKTLNLLADILDKKGENENATSLLVLNRMIRVKNKWKCEKELIDRTEQEFKNNNYQTILNKCRKIWGEKVNKPIKSKSEICKGKILKILPGNGAGFIKMDNNRQYFFSFRDIKGNKDKFIEGFNVSFNIVMGFDKKKNRESEKAVNIKQLYKNS